MIKIIDEKMCCGCGACQAICSSHCIEMEERTLGTIFPVVDAEKCIHCDACDQVCPILNPFIMLMQDQVAFAAYAKDAETRNTGSSGGVFGVLAKNVIENGGTVYGAKFDQQMKLYSAPAYTKKELGPLYKSKYLQSDMSQAFKQVEMQLKHDALVLFVATPCQVLALKRYLKKDYPNLLLVDFFCHGVPSQKFFDECLEYEDQKSESKTLSYTFRVKKPGGSTPHYYMREVKKNGKSVKKIGYYFESLFYAAFQQYITLRESCYNCPFSSRNRASDITIGDFHDIDRYVSGINRFDGVSTVILNTTKGVNLFENVEKQLQLYKVDLEQMIFDGTIFCGPTHRPKHREEFVECYQKQGIAGIEQHYFGKRKYLKNRFYYSMPKGIRKVLKRIL